MTTATKLFDITTHNGRITLRNPSTGGHRTLRIRTIPKDSKFAPGQRVAELLIGGDNDNDYQGFGFVVGGTVSVWRSKQTQAFAWYAKFLANPERFPEIEVFFEGRCRVCNRALTTPESVESGIGPVCEGRE